MVALETAGGAGPSLWAERLEEEVKAAGLMARAVRSCRPPPGGAPGWSAALRGWEARRELQHADVLQRARAALAAADRDDVAGRATALLCRQHLYKGSFDGIGALLRALPGGADAAAVVGALEEATDRLFVEWRELLQEQEERYLLAAQRLREEHALEARRLRDERLLEVGRLRAEKEKAEAAASSMLAVIERLEQENERLSLRGLSLGRTPRAVEEEVGGGEEDAAPAGTPMRLSGSLEVLKATLTPELPHTNFELPVNAQNLTLRQWKKIVRDVHGFITQQLGSPSKIYRVRPDAKAAPADSSYQKLVSSYLEQRLGIFSAVEEWRRALLKTAVAFQAVDVEASIFVKCWHGLLDSTFFQNLTELNKRFDALVAKHLSEKYEVEPGGSGGGGVASLLHSKLETQLSDDEWGYVLGHVRTAFDREAILDKCVVNPTTNSVETSQFRHAVLSTIIAAHEANLAPILHAFEEVGRGAERLSYDDFTAFCRLVQPDMSAEEIRALIKVLDSEGLGRISLQRSLHKLSSEIFLETQGILRRE